MKGVVILGAGASADFGLPVLSGVFKDLEARRFLEENPNFLNQLNRHFWYPRGLDLESSNRGVTVEEILTTIRDFEENEYGLESFLKEEDQLEFSKNLYCLIKKSVFDGKSSSRGRFLNPVIDFCSNRYTKSTWGSFNWDCIFESSFYYHSGSPGPLGGRHNPKVAIKLNGWRNSNSSHLFLKLHGGVNWWITDGNLEYLPFSGRDLNQRWADYYSGRATGRPAILEPSFYKYDDQEIFPLLENQWQIFVQELIEADEVIILGYSAPEFDTKARQALMYGFQGNMRSRWLVVNPSQDHLNKYQRILGDRRVAYLEKTISSFSSSINEEATRELERLKE